MVDTTEIETFDATAVNSARARRPLYEARKKIFPKKAEGSFRRFKWIVMLITLGIYYLTPWLRWDRGPYAPGGPGLLIDLGNGAPISSGSRSGRRKSISSPAC
jgi:hypothetical protein